MKKFKDLRAADFPGVDEQKFQKWKDAHAAANKILLISILVLVVLNVFTIIVFQLVFFPGILLIIPIAYFLNRKYSKLRKELGITIRDIMKAREVKKL